ncbi:MAG: LCP family protein [bacterium]|nr:LCP family protein [bacterium]
MHVLTQLKRSHSWYGKRLILGFVACLIFFLLFVFLRWNRQFSEQTGLTPVSLTKILLDGATILRSEENRTNILILGIGGEGHTGSDLTDTMIVVSVSPKEPMLALLSLPRDVWSDAMKDKINSAYHYGEEKKEGGGMTLAKAVAYDVTGLRIHYGFLIDFSGFKKIIDLVDGVDIVVPEPFTDTEFPVPGKEDDLCDGDPAFACRYTPLHFDGGPQHLDGTRALEYVRSRHAEGEEGTDFARGRRQQDILIALKNKLFDPKIWLSNGRVRDLYRAFDDAIQTDMNVGELAAFGKLLLRMNEHAIRRVSIEELLLSPPLWMYGRYVLVPETSFEDIHEFIKQELAR